MPDRLGPAAQNPGPKDATAAARAQADDKLLRGKVPQIDDWLEAWAAATSSAPGRMRHYWKKKGDAGKKLEPTELSQNVR